MCFSLARDEDRLHKMWKTQLNASRPHRGQSKGSDTRLNPWSVEKLHLDTNKEILALNPVPPVMGNIFNQNVTMQKFNMGGGESMSWGFGCYIDQWEYASGVFLGFTLKPWQQVFSMFTVNRWGPWLDRCKQQITCMSRTQLTPKMHVLPWASVQRHCMQSIVFPGCNPPCILPSPSEFSGSQSLSCSFFFSSSTSHSNRRTNTPPNSEPAGTSVLHSKLAVEVVLS